MAVRDAAALTMQARLQMSAVVSYSAPRITSGERYCRVWMSLLKCSLIQHELPRSAILKSANSIFCRRGLTSAPVNCD